MYRIDIGKLEMLRASAEALKTTLQESVERIGKETAGLENVWEGDTVEDALEAGSALTQDMLLAAAYPEMLERVLSEAEEKALYLKSRCRSLEGILEGEEGTAIGVYVNTEEGKEGVLTLDEELTGSIEGNCASAAENAVKIEKATEEIEALLGSLTYANIKISAAAEAIRTDCGKIKRMEEYGRVYADYAEKMAELDSIVCEEVSAYLPEERIPAIVYEPALWEGEVNVTRILYLMETGREGLTEEEGKELEKALDYIKEGKDKKGISLLLYEYLCMCGAERELTDIEKEYLGWGAVQLELVLLGCYGSEEEKYEKVLDMTLKGLFF